ncbi:hypothetical protein R3P38DRAFT_691781 [Favolaschia claudopus]|uniref:F-box domain-containing protein n=1 Tax=Favolaschia claudopus TaxID=2862362 RepID=A0AAW0EBJ4_9AGAR
MVKRSTVRIRRSRVAISAPIPPEICAIICEMVADRGSLLMLCRTSSVFRVEAQRLLYRTVDLSEKPVCARKLNAWAAVVSMHAYLAGFVHSLVLRLPDMVSFEAYTANKLGRALSKCVNLKELRILAEEAGSVVPGGWILNGCSFRLTHFENHYFDNTVIREFWKRQTELLVVSSEHNVCAMDPDQLLPRLIAVKTDSIEQLPVKRLLERVELPVWVDLAPLQQYQASLTTLNLVRNWISLNPRFQIGAVMKVVAETLPNLEHFGIIEMERCRDKTVYWNDKTSQAVLQKFLGLQTLALQMQSQSCFLIEGANNPRHHFRCSTDVCDFGREIMTMCSTLRRVAICVKFNAVGLNVLTRSQPGGTICEEPGSWPGIETFSMFWKPSTVPLPVHED